MITNRKISMDAKLEGKRHARFHDLLYMAYANLRSKKFRSSITIIGIAIGAGSIFLLMSFGIGLQNLVTKQISDGISINTIDVSVAGSKLLKIDDDAIRNMSAINGVTETSGFFAKASKLTVNDATADAVLYGIDDLYLKTGNFNLVAGRNIDPTKSDEIMIGSSILEALGVTDFTKVIDTEVQVQSKLSDDESIDRNFTVVGVVSSSDGSESFVSSDVFYDLEADKYIGVKVLATDREHVPTIRQAIEGMGYVTASPVDTLNQVDQFFRVLRLILVGFGTIGMVIAILGMINTLTISLLERTKEVALMLALGARPKDMKILFIIEAQILSLSGAVFGIIGALLAGFVVDIVMNRLAVGRGAMDGFSVFATPIWLIAATLFSMVVVGLVVAYIPAMRASRINSIEALRRE